MSMIRAKRLKSVLFLAIIGLAASLGFTFWRARRLLGHAAQIASHSAGFSRDYYLGSGPDVTYLAMGDSTAAGFGANTLEATYPHRIASAIASRRFRVRVVNVAQSGATTPEVRREQSVWLRRLKPDLVSLSVGANDATHRTSDLDFERETRLLWADLEVCSASQILVANVPDMFLAPALPLPLSVVTAKRAHAFNQILETLPPTSRLQIVDLYGAGKLDYGRDPGLYSADLFHPSGRGYAIWAQLFIQKLKKSEL